MGKGTCGHRCPGAANLGLGSLPHGDRWQSEKARKAILLDRVRRHERGEPWTERRPVWGTVTRDDYCHFLGTAQQHGGASSVKTTSFVLLAAAYPPSCVAFSHPATSGPDSAPTTPLC